MNNDLLKYPIFNNPESLRLAKRFKRKCPKEEKYISRLSFELNMIIKKNFVDNILRARDVLDLIPDIPHIIRGSSGSSLVCYLLDISFIDPVKHEISFARFLSEYRTSLADFDFDISRSRRDEAFKRIFNKWGNKVARISNHVMYSHKGAIRKAIKELGYNHRVPKNQCNVDFFGPERRDELTKLRDSFVGTQKCFSRHVGGIIFNDNGFNQDDLLNEKQVKFNKDDIDRLGLFKIDILSNRGLSQLFDISKLSIEQYPENDQKTIDLLCSANNLGLTFGESPAMKKILHTIQPKNINDLAICLAIIRPCAAGNKEKYSESNYEEGMIIFDDDAINYIKTAINCSDDMADKYRRSFSKNKWQDINQFDYLIKNNKDKIKIKRDLGKLRKYSFCKAHSTSYGYLVWALAYQKAHNPKEFWIATLNNCSSFYRPWVHFREAINSGLEIKLGYRPWKLESDGKTLYSVNSKKTKGDIKITNKNLQYKIFGYWNHKEFLDDMYVKVINQKSSLVEFRGLIAIGKYHRKKVQGKYEYVTFVTIGYKNGYYVDLVLNKSRSISEYDIIKGTGTIVIHKNTKYIHLDVQEYKLSKLI